MNNIRKDYNKASRLSRRGNNEEALKIYERDYDEHPELFLKGHRISFAWAIYNVHIKNFTDEIDLIEATEFITELIDQADSNKVKYCPYTLSVLKVIKLLYDRDEFYNLLYWLEKINPDLLSQKRGTFNSKPTKSVMEKFYDRATKTYLECEDYEICLEMSKKALESLDEFTNGSDIWYRWRIAKSLKELNQNQEALKYLKEVSKVKKDWFVQKEFVDNYLSLDMRDEALEYISKAILAKGSSNYKVNLYSLIYHLLKQSEPEIALKHAQLYYLLKIDTSSVMDEDIEDLMIDESELNQKQLEREISDYWLEYKFKDQELQYGTIVKFFEEKNFGFIKNQDDESVFFHKSQFNGDHIYIGQAVSFYTEKRFDKSKNKDSINAVNIQGDNYDLS